MLQLLKEAEFSKLAKSCAGHRDAYHKESMTLLVHAIGYIHQFRDTRKLSELWHVALSVSDYGAVKRHIRECMVKMGDANELPIQGITDEGVVTLIAESAPGYDLEDFQAAIDMDKLEATHWKTKAEQVPTKLADMVTLLQRAQRSVAKTVHNSEATPEQAITMFADNFATGLRTELRKLEDRAMH